MLLSKKLNILIVETVKYICEHQCCSLIYERYLCWMCPDHPDPRFTSPVVGHFQVKLLKAQEG